MATFSTFETLPDEIILIICKYLRGTDVIYAFSNLNSRLNITITGYCRYVNLMTVPYNQFTYVVTHILPCIGDNVRSFVLNCNWVAMISDQLFNAIFTSHLSLLCPQLQKLTLRCFNNETILSLLDNLDNFLQLHILDIQCLQGEITNDLLPKLFSSNSCRLSTVTFDYDSTYLDISKNLKATSYQNIEELTINITEIRGLPTLFKLVPNVRCLCIYIEDWLDGSSPKDIYDGLVPLVHLVNFQLSSVNCFWTFDEIAALLQRTPSLQQLMLEICTDDKRFLREENLFLMLPASCIKIDYLVHYRFSELNRDVKYSLTSQSVRLSTVCLLDERQNNLIIHTLACSLCSVHLPASIGKKLLSRQEYAPKVEHLCIYRVTNIFEVILILKYFRRIRNLHIVIYDELEIPSLPPLTKSTELKLISLKELHVTGIFDLSYLLGVSPNLVELKVNFNCLKTFVNKNSMHYMSQLGIRRLTVTNWSGVKSDLLSYINQTFGSLVHMEILMANQKAIIDPLILAIIPFWKRKLRLSLAVKGLLSKETELNPRKWLTNNSILTEKDSFAVLYEKSWFKLWL